LHAFVFGKGLKLVATGKAADEAAASTNPVTGEEEEVPVDGWQDLPEAYVFRYAVDQAGGAPVLLKCLVAGNHLLVHAAAVGTPGSPAAIEIDVERHTTPSDDLMKGFRDLDGLAATLESALQPVIDAARPKEGSEAASKSTTEQNQTSEDGFQDTRQQPASRARAEEPTMRDPLRDDPLRIGGVGGFPAPRMPGMGIGVGGDDLIPGGLGMPGMRGGMHMDPMMGGMHMGPGNPMFSGGLRHPGARGGTMMQPPGSRYDPIGPPGIPGWDPEDFQRGGR